MSDRELLEQAATAYFGADGFEWNSCAGFAGCIQHIPKGLTHYVTWSPLEDDGDALRLAVKLDIHFKSVSASLFSSAGYAVNEIRMNYIHEPHGNDPYAATRRAIVRAAAEIGKNS